MPRPSKIELLPEELRAELNERLVKGAFSGYEALEDWFAEQGIQIGKSSIHRYGSNLERQLAAIKASTAAAVAIASAAPDDSDLRSAATISMVQTDIFNVLVALQEAENAEPAERLKLLSSAAKSVAELSRASVNQKKWQLAVQEKTKIAADAVTQVARKGGLTEDAIRTIEAEVLKIGA